jgi:hypothetical protein
MVSNAPPLALEPHGQRSRRRELSRDEAIDLGQRALAGMIEAICGDRSQA